MKTITSVVATVALMLSAVAPAFGQTLDAYSNQGGQQQNLAQGGLEEAQVQAQGVSGGADNGAAPDTRASSPGGSSSLPFTGLDVALLLGAGGVLAAAGFGMRRLTRAPHSV